MTNSITTERVADGQAYVTVLLQGLGFVQSPLFFCSKECARRHPSHVSFMRLLPLPYEGEQCETCESALVSDPTLHAYSEFEGVLAGIDTRASWLRDHPKLTPLALRLVKILMPWRESFAAKQQN
jgi:hypothetical protein